MLGPNLRSPQQAAAEAAPPSPSLVTTKAEVRVLAEDVTLRGQILPGPSVPLAAPAGLIGADAVVTRVRIRKGDVLGEGQAIAEVADQPLMTLKLPFPLYRDIAGGAKGRDVTEVQRALRRLGYDVRLTGIFDAVTQAAFSRWYDDEGYTAPRGDQAPLAEAKQNVAATRAAYREAVAAKLGVAAAKKALTDALETLAEAKQTAGPRLLRSYLVRLARSGQKITTVRIKTGSVLSSPDRAVVAELDGSAPQVVLTVSTEQVGLLAVGQRATVLDETSGSETTATVKSIGAEVVEDPASGSTGFPVRLTFTGTAINAPNRSVRVDVTASEDREPKLAVPVTAVYSRPDGSLFVTVVTEDGTEDVTVRDGQSGGGWVAIEAEPAGAVAEGTQVVVGSD
ncbi:peptidoglycan-binding domain-containing protein [Actinoplanes sp. NPDC049802]|uniref:peptidoglycan-binding domain-containing protein n=1 Tax=Actinoplanes sp. NPDC049802 TaxID=3154742 RepID=UPI0033FEDC85